MKVFIGILLTALALFAAPDRAACSSCPDKQCSHQCARGCSCVKGPGEKRGSCWKVEYVPALEAAGWKELP